MGAGTAVTDNPSDRGWLIPMVDSVADAYGETPEQVLADANYSNERDRNALVERDIDGYVAPAREGKAAAAAPEQHPAKARIAEKLASPGGRRRYARRTCHLHRRHSSLGYESPAGFEARRRGEAA